MSRAGDAYTALTAALDVTPAECLDIELFVQDDLSKFEADALAAICADCPVLNQCRSYAAIARPVAGFWAGRRASAYRASSRRSAK